MIKTDEYRKYLNEQNGSLIIIDAKEFSDLLDAVDKLQQHDPEFLCYKECQKYNITKEEFHYYQNLKNRLRTAETVAALLDTEEADEKMYQAQEELNQFEEAHNIIV